MTAGARGEGREDPFRVTGAIPRLIQRFQRSGTRTLVSRDLMFGYGSAPIGLSEKYMGPHRLKLKIQLYILKFHVSYGTGPVGLLRTLHGTSPSLSPLSPDELQDLKKLVSPHLNDL